MYMSHFKRVFKVLKMKTDNSQGNQLKQARFFFSNAMLKMGFPTIG
jgi:hypothetical protein